MAVAAEQLALYLLTAEGLVRCRAADGFDDVAVVATDLDGENIREVCQDPFDPRRLYAASTTDVYLSETGGINSQFIGRIGKSNIVVFHHFDHQAAKAIRDHRLEVATALRRG